MPYRVYWIRFQRIFRRLARGSGTPHQIATGVLIGVIVGMTPTVGLQMIIAVAIAWCLRANRVAAALPVWITNPATVVPIYLFNYEVGKTLVGGPSLRDVKHAIESLNQAQGISDGMHRLAQIGWELQLPLWLGCVIVGIACGVPAYFLTLSAVKRIRQRVQHKREMRHDRVQKWLTSDTEMIPKSADKSESSR